MNGQMDMRTNGTKEKLDHLRWIERKQMDKGIYGRSLKKCARAGVFFFRASVARVIRMYYVFDRETHCPCKSHPFRSDVAHSLVEQNNIYEKMRASISAHKDSFP